MKNRTRKITKLDLNTITTIQLNKIKGGYIIIEDAVLL